MTFSHASKKSKKTKHMISTIGEVFRKS